MMSSNKTIDALLERLYHPGLARIDMSLGRVKAFLSLLGSPQEKMPPVVHVAGTNGKGSLIANLQSIFESAGYTCHRYISPHLVRFNERILVAGKMIEDDYLESLLRRISDCVDRQPATFFESTTAAALTAFAEHKADVVLLETGMGGALDATNVIDRPALTAITPIAFDHMKYLGNDIASIAREKAGIIKTGVPCVVGRQEADAMRVLQETAEKNGASMYRLGMEWQWQRKGPHAVYSSRKRTMSFHPALAGRHQYDNAAAAIACIDQLPEFCITDAQIQKGLTKTSWPGRLQPITQGGYRDLLPPHLELWLDGGHNPQGGEMLAAWLKEQNKDVYLVCGMVQDKDVIGYFRPLERVVREVYAITIPGETTSLPAEEIKKAAMAAHMAAIEMPGIENALQLIAQRAKKPGIVCICGSLYLAGAVLAYQEKVLKNVA